MSDISFKELARELADKDKAGSSILLLVVLTLAAVIVLWATVTELDNVVRGSGKTVSAANNQLVQSSEPGVLRTRYVDEGDIVTRGQLLFDIDPVDAKAQLDQALQIRSTLQVKSIRLQAEIDQTDPTYSEELTNIASAAIETEIALYNSKIAELRTKEAILEQRRNQKLNEINELKIDFDTASSGLKLIKQEIQTVAPLVRNGLAPETRLIALQREEQAFIGKASSAQAAQLRIENALAEIKEQLLAAEQEYLTSSLSELSDVKAELLKVEARIPALQNKVDRTSVRSPIDGVVNRLNYVTADAYVNTGDILLELVPTGSDLMVEARLDPKDIAEITIGNDVKISLTAFDPTRYGRIDGKVKNISADAISDGNSNQQYYVVDISLDSKLFEDNGDEVTVLPGMVASIDVLSGKRTVLDYFWQPMARLKETALRD